MMNQTMQECISRDRRSFYQLTKFEEVIFNGTYQFIKSPQGCKEVPIHLPEDADDVFPLNITVIDPKAQSEGTDTIDGIKVDVFKLPGDDGDYQMWHAAQSVDEAELPALVRYTRYYGEIKLSQV